MENLHASLSKLKKLVLGEVALHFREDDDTVGDMDLINAKALESLSLLRVFIYDPPEEDNVAIRNWLPYI